MMEKETLVLIDPNLRTDFQVVGEEGLRVFCVMVRASWKDNQSLIITAERIIFKPE